MKSHALLLILLLAAIGCQRSAPPVADSTETGTVTVEIELDGQVRQFAVPDVPVGTTVETVMRGLEEVAIEITGTGTTAFVKSIAATPTSASEGWTYRIDGEFASEGIGSTQLTPPTTIDWKFGNWSQSKDDPNP